MDIARFHHFMAAAVSDSLHCLQTMDAGIKSMVRGRAAAGPAFTVRCFPGSISTLHKALLEAKPGDVLVVDGAADNHGALLGELMALQCKINGFAGVVIDGCVRDYQGLNELGFPVFARHLTPCVGTNRRLGELQVDISCGGIAVHPGDWIMADDDGVVVIPADKLEEVVAASEAVELHEREIAERIKKGEQIADILNMRDRLYADA